MRAYSRLLFTSAALSFTVLACSGDDTNPPPGGTTDAATDGTTSDTGAPDAVGATTDSGNAPDAAETGATDAETIADANETGADANETIADAAETGADANETIADAAETGADANETIADAAETGADANETGAGITDAGADGAGQALVTTIEAGAAPIAVTINQGTAIGEGALNGATPVALYDVSHDDSNNTQTVTSASNPFAAVGTVPDTAAGFCAYPDGGTPTRVSYVTGAKFETADGGDPMVPMAPYYFPLVYTTTNTPSGNAFGGDAPIIGLFDWRPKDIDEAVVAAESDDNGITWYFMQTVLELNPDYTNPISGGYSAAATNTGCPATITSTNATATSASGSSADDGWGHAAIIQLPGAGNAKTGQFLYLLDRNTNDMPGTSTPWVDNAPLHVINLTASSNKFPIWNTNSTEPGANDVKSITSALQNTPDAGSPVVVQNSVGLLNPDGIMAVFPTAAGAAAGSPVTVLYVQKIVDGDDTGSTALPAAQQCKKAPFSGKTNHDISNVRLATTTDGVTFIDLGIVLGLNDPTTVDYNQTRWISPRGTLLDIYGDGSRWGLYFSGGNCLDGDSDAFHFIGYAESTDMKNWTVYNDINSPIASINTITTTNQADGTTVTIPANAPVFPTQPWFAERLYAPTATQIDSTHLSLTFAGYGVQTPATDLLDYRQIGNVVLTVSQPLPPGVPNNINAH